MRSGIDALTEREKETLRLLLGGHDAKSIARVLDLSIHTVNERLRDARRKLVVSSSREAARLLAESEGTHPQRIGDKEIGLASDVLPVASGPATRPPRSVGRLAWFAGGMLIMSIVIGLAVITAALQGHGGAPAQGAANAQTAMSTSAAQAEALGAAQTWLALIDKQRWEDSWRTAAAVFRSKLTAQQWAGTIAPVRQQLGAVTGRSFASVTRTSTLPGVPAGQYEVIEFRTSFEQAASTIETAVLIRETDGWKVTGYFVKPG